MSHHAFVLTRNSYGENTRRDEAYERFLSILPSCGFSVTSGAIHPPRSVLNNTYTIFIDGQYFDSIAKLHIPVVYD